MLSSKESLTEKVTFKSQLGRGMEWSRAFQAGRGHSQCKDPEVGAQGHRSPGRSFMSKGTVMGDELRGKVSARGFRHVCRFFCTLLSKGGV